MRNTNAEAIRQIRQPDARTFRARMSATAKHIARDKQLLVLFIPCLIYAIFRYGPLYGLIIAFKDYNVFTGILDSPWVGLKHFERFFASPDFFVLFRNTLLLGLLTMICVFPFPILLAVMLNEVRLSWFKRTIQTASYLPTFCRSSSSAA